MPARVRGNGRVGPGRAGVEPRICKVREQAPLSSGDAEDGFQVWHCIYTGDGNGSGKSQAGPLTLLLLHAAHIRQHPLSFYNATYFIAVDIQQMYWNSPVGLYHARKTQVCKSISKNIELFSPSCLQNLC